MPKYSPSDILRKFVIRQCIEHLVVTSEHAVWINITFWENVTAKAYAQKCWERLKTALVRENPDFRMVGIWARQKRGAWHIHGVCNQRFDLAWFKNVCLRSGFGEQHYLKELDSRRETPERIARYICNYVTDKNGLDPVTDKGVRRTIFVGKETRFVDMRYKSSLKQITAAGRELCKDLEGRERRDLESWEVPLWSYTRKASQTWGEWYKANRSYWFTVGWHSMSPEERDEMMDLDDFTSRFFDTGRWSYV